MWSAASVALVIAAYLLGSISPAYVIARLRGGIDLRHYGTGNVGSSNLGVQLGPKWAIASGMLDWGKGLLPVLLARYWGFETTVVVLAGVAAVVGHDWSLFLGLTGGRGIGTILGVLFGWDVRLAAVLLAFLAIGFLARQGAPASAVGLICLTPGALILGDGTAIIAGCAALALLAGVKRLEANRLPLPSDRHARMVVLLRRLWMDRDVAANQPWESRKPTG